VQTRDTVLYMFVLRFKERRNQHTYVKGHFLLLHEKNWSLEAPLINNSIDKETHLMQLCVWWFTMSTLVNFRGEKWSIQSHLLWVNSELLRALYSVYYYGDWQDKLCTETREQTRIWMPPAGPTTSPASHRIQLYYPSIASDHHRIRGSLLCY